MLLFELFPAVVMILAAVVAVALLVRNRNSGDERDL
jgi:hypothetical protein